MSHSTHPTHPTHPSTGHPHKTTVEHFANALNNNHFNDLNKYLDENVEKTIGSDVVYKNLKEAQDYYQNNKTSQWKIVHFIDENDHKGNTIQTKVTHDNKTYNTKYTFSNNGKIQRIDSTIDNNNK